MYFFLFLERFIIINDNNDIIVKIKLGDLFKELDLFKWNGNVV